MVLLPGREDRVDKFLENSVFQSSGGMGLVADVAADSLVLIRVEYENSKELIEGDERPQSFGFRVRH